MSKENKIKNVLLVFKLTDKYKIDFPFSSSWNSILIEDLVPYMQSKNPLRMKELSKFNIEYYLQCKDFMNVLRFNNFEFLKMFLSESRML